MMMFGFFFFSSRRRHTRFDCDWSSDVCSSDLGYSVQMTIIPQIVEFLGYDTATAQQFVPTVIIGGGGSTPSVPVTGQLPLPIFRTRSVVTSCNVWDGQTVELGGLLSENASKHKA